MCDYRTDFAEAFAGMTYKCVKQADHLMLQEVPVKRESRATLCRLKKGDCILKMEQNKAFVPNREATFGDVKIMITRINFPLLHCRVIEGQVPPNASIAQTTIAVTPEDVQQAFADFWKPMWQRDSLEETQHAESWENFVQTLEMLELPDVHMEISLAEVELWKKAISQLKDSKAAGVDGWQNRELKLLPHAAVDDLMHIVNHTMNFGLHPQLMQAKVTLLAKVAQPNSMEHGRPISVLPTIYRLVSKVIYSQVIDE